MNSDTFLKLGTRYTNSKSSQSYKMKLRRFKSFFGVTPLVCSLVWFRIKNDAPADSHPKHLLWGLLFLKQYSNEHIRRSILDADEKTIRKWTWIFVKLISDMNVVLLFDKAFDRRVFHDVCFQIIWEKRFDGSVPNQTCYCSLDGLDIKILEPKPFSSKWYSHKFHSSGLRYEVGLNIRTGHIVWTNGGYPCGDFPDLTIARQAFIFLVNNGERTLADKGYPDSMYFILPNQQNAELHDRIMSRHETVNNRLRMFLILKHPFRHDLKKHPMVFKAVANLVQLMIENGEPLFKAM